MMFKMVEKILYLGLMAMVLYASLLGKAVAKTKFSARKVVASQQVERTDYSVVYRKNGKRNWWEENQTPSTRFRVEQLVAPVALVGIGALGIGENSPMRGINLAVRDGMTGLRKNMPLRFDDYVQYVPVALYLTMGLGKGAACKHSFGERVAVAATTYLALTAMTQGLKHSVREPRPDTGVRNSFPSGHTATVFAGAELIRTEYGWAYGAGAYALAATVGFMRMYNGRHWLNDVLAGAGVGILSARIGYWLLPLNRHIFKIPRKQQAFVATPIYYSEVKGAGLACAIQF